jgi:hypothetical protein
MNKLNIHDLQEKVKQHETAKSNLCRCKKKESQTQKLPYPAGDGKTVFYCSTPERGAERVAEYQRKLKKFTNL